jgi:hypothetical protein
MKNLLELQIPGTVDGSGRGGIPPGGFPFTLIHIFRAIALPDRTVRGVLFKGLSDLRFTLPSTGDPSGPIRVAIYGGTPSDNDVLFLNQTKLVAAGKKGQFAIDAATAKAAQAHLQPGNTFGLHVTVTRPEGEILVTSVRGNIGPVATPTKRLKKSAKAGKGR